MISRPNCKLCTSPYRAQAEEAFRQTGNRRAVHRWLLEQGENISYQSLKSHFAHHFVNLDADSEASSPAAVVGPLDILGTVDVVHTLALQQVQRLASVRTDERNVGPVSSALFRGLDLLLRQANIKALLLGYYDPVDEPTRLQFNGVVQRLGAILAGATDEQRQILAPIIEELEQLETRG